MSKKFKLFIASSGELMDYRNELELKIASKNKILMDEKDLFVELVRWEDLSAIIAQERLQKIYDEEIKVCDMFVLLAFDKIGQFTKEEFYVAYETFKRKGKPKILTFFNKSAKSIDNTIDEFKKELDDIGHFYNFYDSFDDFWIQLNKQLDILLKKPKDSKTPKQIGSLPPFNPSIFLGRDSDIENIYKSFFEDGKAVLLINGNGGIGKTTIASKYYHQYQDEYTHQIWAFNESEIDNTILSLATELNISFDAKDTKEQSVTRVLKRLNELDKPTLFIIDNVDSLEDLEKNYQYLLQVPKLHILITSRVQDFDFFEKHNIDKLPPDIAKELFLKHYKKHKESESELLDRVLEMIDYNTLLIEILAKNLNQFNKLKPYTLQDMLQDMVNGGILNIKAKEINTQYHKLKKQTPQDIIQAMYSFSNLNELETKVLSIFSIIPAIAIPFEELESFLKIEDLDELLLKLYNTSWLNYDEENSTFSINPIVAEIVRDKNKTSLYQNAQELIDEVINVLDYEGYDKATVYVSYAESILNFLKYNKEAYYDLSIIADIVGKFYQSYGSAIKTLEYYEEYNRLIKELYESNPQNVDYKNSLAISYERLGNIYTTLGDTQEALKYYKEYNRLTKELYESDKDNVGFKNNLAISYQNLGNTYKTLGDIDEALKYYKEFNILEKELYDSNKESVKYKNGLAISYQNIGSIYETRGDIDKALECYEKYNRLEKELYESDKENVEYKNSLAVSYNNLGNTYKTLGDIDKALNYYEETNKLLKELYESNKEIINYKNNLAVSYQNLGNIYKTLGDIIEALKYYKYEVKLFEELYESNKESAVYKNNLAISYGKLGDIYVTRENIDKALECYEKYNRLEKELYESDKENVEYKNSLAVSYNNLGNIYKSRGNTQKAFEYYEKVAKLFKELYESNPQNVDYKNGLAISYINLFTIYAELQDTQKAKEYIDKSYSIYQELTANYPQNVEYQRNYELVKEIKQMLEEL